MKKILSKVFIIILSFFMFFVIITNVKNVKVVAAKGTNTTQTTDVPKRVTNKDLWSKIQNEFKQKKEDEVANEKFWRSGVNELKKAKTYDRAISNQLVSIANLFHDPENADVVEFAYDTFTNVINCIAAGYGLGEVSNTIFTLIKDFGENKSTDLQKFEERIYEQFDLVHERFDEIQRDIQRLSKNIDQSTETILNALDDAFYAYEAKEQIKLFMSGRSGSFNYKRFKSYLFGSNEYSELSYYNLLLNQINSDYPDETLIGKYYDLLYTNLYSTGSGDNQLTIFYDFVNGDKINGIDSIQKYYYDFLLSNSENISQYIPEYEAILFALDLYTTALFAEHIITICNNYQMIEMYNDYGSNLNNNSIYYYGDNSSDFITYGQILENNERSEERLSKLSFSILRDLIYILNIDGSYTVANENDIKVITNNDINTFGQVNLYDTVYLNKLPDEICEIFDFDPKKFSYSFDNNVVQCEDGVFVVSNAIDNQTLSVRYENEVLYSITFKINNGNSFAGGSGSIDDPYLINSVKQLRLINSIENGLEKHYKLISDVNCLYQTISQIGDKDNLFNGSFDGNSYKIFNYNLSANDYLGLFAHIGYKGKVSNLTLDTGNYNLYNSDNTTFTIGLLAAKNDGIIYNCKINSCNFLLKEDINEINKNVFSSIGGVCGENTGQITYTKVNDCNLEITMNRDYGSETDYENSIELYLGGIVGNHIHETSEIKYCYVSEDNYLSASVKMECYDKVKTRRPNATIYVSGIIGKGQLSGIENVYSGIEDTHISFKSENLGMFGAISEKDVDIKKGPYIPNNDKTNIDFIINTKLNEYEVENVNYNFSGKLKSDYAYGYADSCIDLDDILILCNEEPIEFKIINYYNFNTYNDDKENGKTISVKVFFTAYIDDKEIYSFVDIPVRIKNNEINELIISKLPNIIEYNNLHENIDLSGLELYAHYDNDTYELLNDNISIVGELSNYGSNKIKLIYKNHEIFIDLYVKCNHNYIMEVHKATCENIGYTAYTCNKCLDYYELNYINKLEHSAVLINELSSTCTTNGYSGDLICSDCGILIEKGSDLELSEHVYDKIDGTSHSCVKCNKTLIHEYTCIENDTKYIYSCIQCNYVKPEDKNNVELPKVIVNDAYSLPGSNQVVVFVEIISNPGLTGASFSINYDPKLKFIDYKEGNILKEGITRVDNVDEDSMCYVTIGRAKPDYSSKGTLIKVIFETPSSSQVMDKFSIKISYSRSGVQFSNAENKPLDIVTINGQINVVDHLPGDVNADKVVDIFDAIMISRYLNHQNDSNFDKIYADVNLDGYINIIDMTTLLQYIAGGYGSQIHSNQYTIHLNTNNENSDTISHVVNFYNLIGEKGKYGDINKLPILERQGYKFLGWVTNIEGTDFVDDDTFINYDSSKIKQVLYAKWELNEVIFNGNGSTNIDTLSKTYFENGSIIKLNNPFEKQIAVNFVEYDLQKTTKIFNKTFLGWSYIENSDVIYTENDIINLENSNIGKIVLYAVWSNEEIKMENSNSRYGYKFIGWSTDINRINDLYEVNSYFEVEEPVTFYDVWNTIEYKIIYDANGGTGTTIDSVNVRSILNQYPVALNCFTRPGYDIEEWNTEKDGSGIKIKKDAIIGFIDDVDENGIVYLYAQWKGLEYDISYDPCGGNCNTDNKKVTFGDQYGGLPIATRTGYKFDGWYTARTGGTEITSKSIVSIPDDHTLYAHWINNTYDINFHANGGSGSMSKQSFTYDVEQELKSNSFNRKFWTFAGWSTNPNSKDPQYTDCQAVFNVCSDGEINLYAIWKINTSNISSPIKWSDSEDIGNDKWNDDSIMRIFYVDISYHFDLDGLEKEGYKSADFTFNFTMDAHSGHTLKATYKILYGTSFASGVTLNNQQQVYSATKTLNDGASCNVNYTFNKELATIKAYHVYAAYFESAGKKDLDWADNEYNVRGLTLTINFKK